MFRKPFRVKSCLTLKSSDRKKLIGHVKDTFELSDPIIQALFPPKEQVSCHKIVTANKENVSVYGCQNRPLFFEVKGIIYPTVYSLWICSIIIPCVTTHESLIERLTNGADLMIPGVTINSSTHKANVIDEGFMAYICTLDNKAAVAVGKTVVSTADMVPGNKGKAVQIYHAINDELCKLFEVKELAPDLGPLFPGVAHFSKDLKVSEQSSSTTVSEKSSSTTVSEKSSSTTVSEKSSSTTVSEKSSNTTVSEWPSVIDSDIESLTKKLDSATNFMPSGSSEESIRIPMVMGEGDLKIDKKDIERNSKKTMDELILFCFLTALKTTASKVQLPILTNIFYKNHMLEAVPVGYSLDIKKTKYKKLSNFLSELSDKGIISLHTDKGVQSIVSIYYNHEIITNFKVEEQYEAQEEEPYPKFEVEEKYVVNNSVDVIFSKFNHNRKGELLSDQELRKCVTDFIKSQNLVDPNREQYVNLNDVLRETLGVKEYSVTWKALFTAVTKKMGRAHFIHTPYSGIIFGKGKLPHIKLSTVCKASNKKVTTVDNLEVYGININEFAKECQHGVAASSTINTLPSKSLQFQIQGNQKIFITNLLTEKYGIPKKYIEGSEDQKKKDTHPKKNVAK